MGRRHRYAWAVVTVQRLVRGWIARRVTKARRRTMWFDLVAVPAAVAVQRVYRGHAVRRREQHRKARWRSVGVIAKFWRRIKVVRAARAAAQQRREQRIHDAAAAIQARVRGVQARRLARQVKREHDTLVLSATRVLQRAWRAFLAANRQRALYQEASLRRARAALEECDGEVEALLSELEDCLVELRAVRRRRRRVQSLIRDLRRERDVWERRYVHTPRPPSVIVPPARPSSIRLIDPRAPPRGDSLPVIEQERATIGRVERKQGWTEAYDREETTIRHSLHLNEEELLGRRVQAAELSYEAEELQLEREELQVSLTEAHMAAVAVYDDLRRMEITRAVRARKHDRAAAARHVRVRFGVKSTRRHVIARHQAATAAAAAEQSNAQRSGGGESGGAKRALTALREAFGVPASRVPPQEPVASVPGLPPMSTLLQCMSAPQLQTADLPEGLRQPSGQASRRQQQQQQSLQVRDAAQAASTGRVGATASATAVATAVTQRPAPGMLLSEGGASSWLRQRVPVTALAQGSLTAPPSPPPPARARRPATEGGTDGAASAAGDSSWEQHRGDAFPAPSPLATGPGAFFGVDLRASDRARTASLRADAAVRATARGGVSAPLASAVGAGSAQAATTLEQAEAEIAALQVQLTAAQVQASGREAAASVSPSRSTQGADVDGDSPLRRDLRVSEARDHLLAFEELRAERERDRVALTGMRRRRRKTPQERPPSEGSERHLSPRSTRRPTVRFADEAGEADEEEEEGETRRGRSRGGGGGDSGGRLRRPSAASAGRHSLASESSDDSGAEGAFAELTGRRVGGSVLQSSAEAVARLSSARAPRPHSRGRGGREGSQAMLTGGSRAWDALSSRRDAAEELEAVERRISTRRSGPTQRTLASSTARTGPPLAARGPPDPPGAGEGGEDGEGGGGVAGRLTATQRALHAKREALALAAARQAARRRAEGVAPQRQSLPPIGRLSQGQVEAQSVSFQVSCRCCCCPYLPPSLSFPYTVAVAAQGGATARRPLARCRAA